MQVHVDIVLGVTFKLLLLYGKFEYNNKKNCSLIPFYFVTKK
jgi:hypothetical protein